MFSTSDDEDEDSYWLTTPVGLQLVGYAGYKTEIPLSSESLAVLSLACMQICGPL